VTLDSPEPCRLKVIKYGIVDSGLNTVLPQVLPIMIAVLRDHDCEMPNKSLIKGSNQPTPFWKGVGVTAA
jgi:hypothetical protein